MIMTSLLADEQVILRALEPEDLDILYLWENDPEVWEVSNTHAPFSRFVIKQYLETAAMDIYEKKQLRLMIDTPDGASVGTIDLFDFDPFHQRAGLGILIQKDYRRKSYASHALRVLTHYCFKGLQLKQLYCHIAEDNEPSLKLFESQEFEICGRRKAWLRRGNKWVDEWMLQKLNTARD